MNAREKHLIFGIGLWCQTKARLGKMGVALRLELGGEGDKSTMTAIEKLKAEIQSCKNPIGIVVDVLFTVLLLFPPLIVERLQFSIFAALSFGEWLRLYSLLFQGIKECALRWNTCYKVFCWGSLVLLLLTVIVNCIRLFGSDSIVYDIIVYILVGIIAALIVTDIVLLLQSAKQEFKDDQDT